MGDIRHHLVLLIVALGLPALEGAEAAGRDKVGFDIPGLVIVWAADENGDGPVVSDFVIDTAAGSADTDLVAGDVFTVVTGTLTPTPNSSNSTDVASRIFTIERSPSGNQSSDSNGNGETDGDDRFSSFRIDRRTNLGLADSTSRTSFYVASNTAFNIDAQAIRVVGRDDWVLGKIFWDMSVTRTGNEEIEFGYAAQFPNSGGADSGVQNVPSLLQMLTRRTVFTGDQPTAAARGTIMEQSVRFDVVYTLGSWSGYDLSTGYTNLEEGTYEVEAEVTYTVWVP